SGTGFNSDQLSYSTDGTAFTNFGSAYTPAGSFALQSFDLSTITQLDNQATAFLKITFGGATGTSGNNRLDNVQINGTLIPTAVPLPNAAWGGGVLLGLIALHKRRSSRPSL